MVVDKHCLPQEGECLRSTTYPDCRHCLFAGLSWGRCPRRPSCAPTAVTPLRCGRSVMIRACSRKGCGAVRPHTLHAVAVSSTSGRAALESQPCSLRRSPAAAAPLRCGRSPTSTACSKKGIKYLHQLLGPVPDVMLNGVRHALADLLPAEMCWVPQRYAPTACSRCSESSSSARGAARRDV